MTTLYHGGIGDLWKGSLLLPDMASRRLHDGCAQCEAHRHGLNIDGFDPSTPHGFVYATSDIEYARYYASRAGNGWLYEVALLPPVEESTEDPFPTWRAPQARIVRVLEKRITLTMQQRRALFIRWGGSEEEFRRMISDLSQDPAILSRLK